MKNKWLRVKELWWEKGVLYIIDETDTKIAYKDVYLADWRRNYDADTDAVLLAPLSTKPKIPLMGRLK